MLLLDITKPTPAIFDSLLTARYPGVYLSIINNPKYVTCSTDMTYITIYFPPIKPIITNTTPIILAN